MNESAIRREPRESNMYEKPTNPENALDVLEDDDAIEE